MNTPTTVPYGSSRSPLTTHTTLAAEIEQVSIENLEPPG